MQHEGSISHSKRSEQTSLSFFYASLDVGFNYIVVVYMVDAIGIEGKTDLGWKRAILKVQTPMAITCSDQD
jgi:hypothetical protein